MEVIRQEELTTVPDRSPLSFTSRCHIRWTASTSNMEHEEESVSADHTPSTLGFTSFLIAVKSVTFVIYLVLLIVSGLLLDSSFLYTVVAFGIAELFLIIITCYHGFRPTLKVVFCMLGFEMVLALVKLVFAIVLMSQDGSKQCHIDNSCTVLNITSVERFYLFFFILFTAFTDGLIALLTIANSPQMHDFEMGDKYLF